jgi:hypothetical protein
VPEALDDAALERLLGAPPAALTRLAGGGNSRIYRVTAADGGTFALKHYFRHPGDSRDRLGTETAALAFMAGQGLDCVPRPLGADAQAGLGLYQFIDGVRPEPTDADVDQAAAFLIRLRELSRLPAARTLPAASEARFSLAGAACNVDDRMGLLEREAPELVGFLGQELAPVWRAMAGPYRQSQRELPLGERTLNPSDFGFHNALRRDGQLVFLDFEYFGWDDPAKMIADLLLHPRLGPERVRLARGVLAGFGDQPGLEARVRQVFPLFGIKWCLILLNEFLPGPLGRRQFATAQDSIAERQARQLAKARAQLSRIRDQHDPFALPR